MRRFYFYSLACSVIFLLFISLSGCVSSTKLSSITYFKNVGDSLLSTQIQYSEPKIQIDDQLSINVNALNPESALPYNLNVSQGDIYANSYLVEKDSTIHFPQLGKIKVVGLSRVELINNLSKELVKYVNDPIVTVQFLSYKVTVLGEVRNPGTKSFPNGKVNIIDAISAAGDLTNFANNSKIMVIRESKGKREFGEINLLSRNIFNSPYYHLQQNDIVYIEPTIKRLENENSFIRNLSITTSVISVVSTLIFLIINLTKN